MRQYLRAYCLRAEGDAEAAPGSPLRFVAATEGRKADGIDLRMDGAQLDRYRSNPIFGYGHMYWGREALPIGRATDVTVDGESLLIDVVFDQADEFATVVERKYRDGFLNAVSAGFDVLEWEDPETQGYWTGGVAISWELVEVSSVPVPMDADALVESGRAAAIRAFGQELLALADLDPAASAAGRVNPAPPAAPEVPATADDVGDDLAARRRRHHELRQRVFGSAYQA